MKVAVVDPPDFSPRSITISAGDKVRWVNEGVQPHTTTKDGSWDSGALVPGDSFTVTFDTPGTYNYFCQFHFGQTGTVVVN